MLDKSQPAPLYYQAKERLKSLIVNNTYSVGDLIPSETELQQQYQVSRITIRRAINELVREGLLTTQQGRGTYVSKAKTSQELNHITSWVETAKELGLNYRSEILSFKEIVPPDEFARLLQIDSTEKVYQLKRVRYTNEEPICLMTNYLIPRLVPGILSEGLINDSLYETLEKKYQLVLSRADETVEARSAGQIEASILGVKRGFPLLYAERVTYDPNNLPIEVVITLSRGDRYAYKTRLVGR